MKARILIIGVGFLCVSTLVAKVCFASEDAVGSATATPKAVPGVTSKTAGHAANTTAGDAGLTVLTGSYIPTKVKVVGRTTDGPMNLTVIDRAEIEQSGAATLATLLAREPGLRIRGH